MRWLYRGGSDDAQMPIEQLSDNGSPYSACEIRLLRPCATPIESPQSNGFVKGLKRDYVRVKSMSRPGQRAA